MENKQDKNTVFQLQVMNSWNPESEDDLGPEKTLRKPN